MEAVRLEPLVFVGYERQLVAAHPGEVPHSSSLVHFVTPHGVNVLLHPSAVLGSPQSTSLSPQQQLALSLPPAGGAAGAKASLPPPPSASAAPTLSAQTNTSGAVPSRRSDTAPATAAEEPDVLLKVLTSTSSPPENFQVEFVLSSSSATSSSSASSRSSSSSSSSAHDTATLKEDMCKDEEVRTVEASPLPAASAAKERFAEADLESMNSSDALLPPHYEHGLELILRGECQAAVSSVLTQCALRLFNGRLPQQQQQQQDPNLSADLANSQQEQQQLELWSEAIHYRRVVLMGYDSAGMVGLMAIPFAQPVPPPQSWRLCPLPLLMCPVAQLTHLYTEVHEGSHGGTDAASAAAVTPRRYPVLPRLLSDINAGSRQSSRTASPPPSASNSPPRGIPLLPPHLPPTPPPPPQSSALRPLSAATAATTTPASLSSAGAYLSPPLRWDFAAIGRIPALDLPRLFQVAPNTVYQLVRPAEEVVFVGFACGVPWVREVVRVAAGTGAVSSLAAGAPSTYVGRGITLHTHGAAQRASAAAATVLPPPPGYRWKDPRGYVVPLVCCHGASDLRGRHGLVDDPAASVQAPPTATTAAGGVTEDSLKTPFVEEKNPTADDASAAELETPPAAASLPPPPPLQSQLRQQQQPEQLASGADVSLPLSCTTTSSPSAPALPTTSSPPPPLPTAPSHLGSDAGDEATNDKHVTTTTTGNEVQPTRAQTALPSPPPEPTHAAAAPPPAAVVSLTSSAPLYVKEGTTVFVPGRFGVMLECVAKPIVLEMQFGVVHGDRLVPRTAASFGPHSGARGSGGLSSSESKGLTPSAVTVMGVYNRNVLVVLADGESQATQIPIRRGVAEVAELFRKIAGTPLPPPALTLEATSTSIDATTAAAAGPTPRSAEDHPLAVKEAPTTVAGDEARGGATLAGKDGVDVAARQPGSTTPSVTENGAHTTQDPTEDVEEGDNDSNNNSPESSAAALTWEEEAAAAVGLTAPDAAEGNPGKATPFISHDDVEVPMPSAPPANAQGSPMFAAVHRAPTPEPSLHPPNTKDAPVQPVSEAAEDNVKDVSLLVETPTETEEKRETGVEAMAVVTTTEPAEAAAAPLVDASGESTTDMPDSSDEETVPSPSAPLLALAEDVTVTSASVTPTTAAPPVEAVVAAAAAPPPPLCQTHSHMQQQQQVKLQPTPGRDSSLLAAHVDDVQESSASVHVLSSDHTPSILPTPSASLARLLQSERYQDDEHAPHSDDVRRAVEKNDGAGQPNCIGGPTAGVAAALFPLLPEKPCIPYLPLPDGPGRNGPAHLLPLREQPTEDPDNLNTAATVIATHEVSTTRSSESPAAVMPESYYAELSAAAAEPPLRQGGGGQLAGVSRHAPHLAPPPPPPHALATPPTAQASASLYQEVFTPSYSPPPGLVEGHTAPHYHVPPPGDVQSYRDSAASASQPASTSVNPQPFSMMTAATTITAVTPTPFVNFMKAFAIYAVQQTRTIDGTGGAEKTSTTGVLTRNGPNGEAPTPLPGLGPILEFYRAQPLVRVVAATEAQRRCRAAWCGVGDVAVQNFRRNASTAVFEELCVDELVILVGLVRH
jgi:hypothetical protein